MTVQVFTVECVLGFRSLFTSSGFMRSHDKVWNRWSSLDPTCPLILRAPPLTFFNYFFHIFKFVIQNHSGFKFPKSLIFKYLILLLDEACGASLAFEGYYFRKKYETFFWFFAHCVMLHETAGILTIITASVITPAGVSNDFNADYIYWTH